VLSVRPKVAELMFQLYGRALHPELFTVHASQTIKRSNYEAKIEITNAGHVVTFSSQVGSGQAGSSQRHILAEVAASANHPLPKSRLLISHPVKGDHCERCECKGGVKYEMRCQLDPTKPDLFLLFQNELAKHSPREGILHRFDSSGRINLGAVSYINLELRSKRMVVQAFHTFPDDCAIVRTRSTFQLP